MSNTIVKIQEDDLTLVVKEQSLGTLVTNAKEVKELVKQALPKYSAENYGEDNIAEAKADKAMLNKFAKEVNSQRLEIQKKWMAPFEEFKREADEIVALTKEASGKIDEVVKAVDDRAKAEKQAEIEAYFASLNFTLVPLERIFNPRWLNKTTKMKAVEEEIQETIATIESSLQSLDNMGEDVEVLKSHYLNTLSLDETLRCAGTLKENRERMARAKAEEEARKATTPEVAPTITPPTAPIVEEATEELLTRTLRVQGTREQIIALGDFMNDNGIWFEKL